MWRGGRSRADRGAANGGIQVHDEEGELVHSAPPEVAASVRYLIARVQLNNPTGIPRRLAITSAVRGEGVTYIARTLGALIAHDLDRSVCIVDLNWWSESRPNDTSTLGLADALQREVPVTEILQSTSSSQLWFAPSGDVEISNRSMMAESPGLDGLLDELENTFDHLILELPAVLVSSDALTLARLCDAFALVVHQGVTTEAQVREALNELATVVSLGVILNRYSSRIPKRLRRLLSQ
jgi:Mrp family chromosome partitioning ATPase